MNMFQLSGRYQFHLYELCSNVLVDTAAGNEQQQVPHCCCRRISPYELSAILRHALYLVELILGYLFLSHSTAE